MKPLVVVLFLAGYASWAAQSSTPPGSDGTIPLHRRVQQFAEAGRPLVRLAQSEGTGAALFEDDFSGGISALWEVIDPAHVRVVDSGHPRHGPSWSSHQTARTRWREGRVDWASVYIKGNGSYAQGNPHFDGNPARALYPEARVTLSGPGAIRLGEWAPFRIQISGAAGRLFVGDVEAPQHGCRGTEDRRGESGPGVLAGRSRGLPTAPPCRSPPPRRHSYVRSPRGSRARCRPRAHDAPARLRRFGSDRAHILFPDGTVHRP